MPFACGNRREIADTLLEDEREAHFYMLGMLNTIKYHEEPLNIAAEVQLLYKPYLSLGRKKSHLHYKVLRCKTAGELLRDANKKVAPHHLTTTGLTRLFMALCALAQYDQWSRTDLRGPLPVTWQVLTDEQKQLYKRCSRLVIEE